MKKKRQPQVSILTAVYNGEEFLDRCFKSVLNQTFKDYELIGVDDGSTDRTLLKMKRWQARIGQDRFLIIENSKNLGLTKSLNRASDRARGKYIARIDADDWWVRTKLEKQVDFLGSHPAYGLVGSSYVNIYPGCSKKFKKLPATDRLIRKKLFRQNPFAHSCVLARRALIKEAGGYDEKLKFGQDYDLWLRCLTRAKGFNLKEFLCARDVSQGISVNQQQAQMLQSIRTRIKYIKKYHYSRLNYLYLIEPALMVLTPNFIKKLKRKYC